MTRGPRWETAARRLFREMVEFYTDRRNIAGILVAVICLLFVASWTPEWYPAELWGFVMGVVATGIALEVMGTGR